MSWNEKIPYIYHGLSAEWEFCEDPETCGMQEWCDWHFCEIATEPLPQYNGIFDFKGNKIDVLDIPIPDLCLTCESFIVEDWDENILCNLTRADEREAGEEFMCYAWRKREEW